VFGTRNTGFGLVWTGQEVCLDGPDSGRVSCSICSGSWVILLIVRSGFTHLALSFFFQLFFFLLLFCQFFLTLLVAVIWCCQCSLSVFKSTILPAGSTESVQRLFQICLQVTTGFQPDRKTHQRAFLKMRWPNLTHRCQFIRHHQADGATPAVTQAKQLQ
jgi:hypothetical protein